MSQNAFCKPQIYVPQEMPLHGTINVAEDTHEHCSQS